MHEVIGISDVKEGNEGIVMGGTFLFSVRLPEKKKAKPRVCTLCLAFLINIFLTLILIRAVIFTPHFKNGITRGAEPSVVPLPIY